MPGTGVGTGPGQFPARSSSFVGRQPLLTALRDTMRTKRLITLIGVGGTGKTRLALELADQVREDFDDVRLVELISMRDPALLVKKVAEALSARDQAVADSVDALLELLTSRRRVLLVMDNCEHLVEDVGTLVATLLQQAPELHVLATSRAPLAVSGEKLELVEPLELPPSPDSPIDLGIESVQLFCDRASDKVSDWAITPQNWPDVVRLLRRCAGIPLAIELAVARLRSMPVSVLARRLETSIKSLDRHDRMVPNNHQSLHDVINWDHDLCTQRERLLWARASVFDDGFTLDAAIAVCADADQLLAEDIEDTIADLVDKSIFRPSADRGRFSLLDPTRLFGLDKLRELGEEASTLDRHTAYYTRFAVTAADSWLGVDEIAWMSRLSADIANLQAVMTRALASPMTSETALVIAVSLGRTRWIFFSGCLPDGRLWLQRAIDATPVSEHGSPLYLGAVAMLSWVSICLGEEHSTVDGQITMVAELAARTGTPSPAVTFARGGYEHFCGGNMPSTIPILRRASEEFEASGPSFRGDRHMARMMVSLSAALLADDESAGQPTGRDTALRIAREFMAEAEQTGAPWAISWARWGLGVAQVRAGDLEKGTQTVIESLQQQKEFGDRWGPVFGIPTLAWILSLFPNPTLDDSRRAASLVGASHKIEKLTGIRISKHKPHTHFLIEATDRLRERLPAADFQQAVDSGSEVESTDEAVRLALAPAQTDDSMLEDSAADERGEQSAPPAGLTEMQWWVAQRVAEGFTNQQVADQINASRRTIEHHLQAIYRVLGFSGSGARPALASWVRERQALMAHDVATSA